MTRILRIDGSMRRNGSVTRALADKLVARLKFETDDVQVIERDLAEGLPFVDESWIAATFTSPDARTAEQRAVLARSDALVRELQEADIIILASPMYNFSVPAAVKAWFDLVARVGITFKYTENGPVGLLEGKTAYLVTASGGVPVDSPVDYATPYVRQFLGFIGITDVTVIAADQLGQDGDAKRKAAQDQVSSLAA